MSGKTQELQPGIYRVKGRAARTLLRAIEHRCVYSFDDPERVLSGEQDRIRATTCSARTFLTVMGSMPARELTPEETKRLLDRMESMVPYRKCNRFQKTLFFPNGSRLKQLDEMRRQAAALPATVGNTGEPPPPPEKPTIFRRVARAIRSIIAWVFHRATPDASPSSTTTQTVTGGAI